jgi:hypothetical protein
MTLQDLSALALLAHSSIKIIKNVLDVIHQKYGIPLHINANSVLLILIMMQ